MKIDRRAFLKNIAMTCGGHALTTATLSPLLLNVTRAMANTGVDDQSNFVLFRIHGSMDSTLGLHPYLESSVGLAEKDLFLGYDPLKEVIREGGITLGPSASSIREFASNMAIVRGIFVGPNDLGHPFAMQHMTSGRAQESAPSWTSYFGDQYGRQSYIVTNTALQRGVMAPLPTLLTTVLRSQVSSAAVSKISSGLKLYKSGGLGAQRFLEFQKQRSKLDKFMDIFNDSNVKNSGSVPDQDLALASLYSGLSRVAQIDINATGELGTLDTHQAHANNHAEAQEKRWKIIGGFLKRLRELNLFEKTLVVVVTEFNRTPGLNDNKGKDHNYSDNAMAIFGRGVNGGTVIGDRQLYTRGDGFPYAYWAGSYLDYESGEAQGFSEGQKIPKGMGLIHPGDVWKTIARSFSSNMVAKASTEDYFLPNIFR